MLKSKTGIVIVLTLLGAGLFIVVLHSRWRTTSITTRFGTNNVKQASFSTLDRSEDPQDSVLAGSRYWEKASKTVEDMIKDKLKSNPNADPNLLAVWQHQVAQHKLELSSYKTNPDDVDKVSIQEWRQKLRPPPTTPAVRLDLPFLTRGSVEIRPERIPPPANSADTYYSLLTAPKYHDTRISLQYLTWFQTVDPKQVHVVTDNEKSQWIQAVKKEGGHIHLPHCPITFHKSKEMMCCKTGAQFDYWYKAREAGMEYKWYCHFDDDLYVNPKALVNMLSRYDPTTDQYLGNYKSAQRYHKYDRLPASYLAPGLLRYTERKRDDFVYANGPSYCISEALMMKAEKYLRGKNFEESCRKSRAAMDDVLPGVIIDGVLGIDLTQIDEFMAQMDPHFSGKTADLKEKTQQKIITVASNGVKIVDGRFTHIEDPNGIFSYHCLIHPEVSWCHR